MALTCVITPLYEKANQYIGETYRSLCDQTEKDWKWLVLENNGGQATPEMYADSRVLVFKAQEDIQGIGALKRHLSLAVDTPYTVELDADDLLRADALELVQKEFAEGADFVYSDVAEFRGDFAPIMPYDPCFGWSSYVTTLDNGKILNAMRQPPLTPQNMRYVMWAPNHVRAWRKDAYLEVGGHEAGMLVADDHDLVVRFYLAGKRFRHVEDAIYYYRIHDENTVKTKNAEIQIGTNIIYDRYIWQLAEKFADDHKLAKIDLCCWKNCRPGYVGWDKYSERDAAGLKRLDVDLDYRWPADDNSVGVIRAQDAVEHLRDPVHTMNEAWRVLAPGGFFLIDVPSAPGKGADCDPTHVSRWNDLSFRYYTDEYFASFIPQFRGKFQVLRVKEYDVQGIPYCQAHLVCQKPGYKHMGPNGWLTSRDAMLNLPS